MYKKCKLDITNLTDIEVYFNVMSGKFKKFPNNFLNKGSCKNILRYVCLNMNNMSREDICHINLNFLFKNYIGSFRRIFNYDVFSLVQYSFPEFDFKRWESAKVSPNFWHSKENQKAFVLWVAQKEHLNLTNLNDIRKMKSKMLISYGGAKAIRAAGGTFELISTATGNKFKEWEVLKLDVWTEDKAIEAVQWLIEERLCWSNEQVVNQLTASIFRANNLGGLLKNYCNNSPIAATNLAYPGKFKSLRHTKN